MTLPVIVAPAVGKPEVVARELMVNVDVALDSFIYIG